MLAYATYLLPLMVLVAVAFFLSTATRNSAAAIVGTVIFSLAFQGIAALPGLGGAKPYLLPQQFEAWQALFGAERPVDRPRRVDVRTLHARAAPRRMDHLRPARRRGHLTALPAHPIATAPMATEPRREIAVARLRERPLA